MMDSKQVKSPSHLNQTNFESTILSFLSNPDSPSDIYIFDRVLNEYLACGDDSVQDQLIDRALHRVLLLLESTKRCFRKRLTHHNSISWLLPFDLTIKVFSMLDTKSLIQAATCCTMFNKYAMDPLCYSHIDFTKASQYRLDDEVLRTMVHRAGKELRSLKLGTEADDYFPCFESRFRLVGPILSSNSEFSGSLLRSLHIYNLISMDINSLSSCSNLIDLKIVGVIKSLDLVLELLKKKYSLIEHLFLESFHGEAITDDSIEELVANCPNLTSLTLKGFTFNDTIAQILVKGFDKLKYMNLSNTSGIDGSFLRDLGHSCKYIPLETLILRDCSSLKESEVLQFLNSLIAGEFRLIRHIDVSRNDGLVCDGDQKTSEPKFPLEKLKEERSDFKFVAEFPSSLQSWSPSPFDESNNDENRGCCWGGGGGSRFNSMPF